MPLKERYNAQILYHVNKCKATCFQCGLDTLLNLPFKAICDLRVHSEHKQYLVFVTSKFISNMICYLFLNCINNHKAPVLFTECNLSRITQDLQFKFRVPIRNTIIMNSQV
jgi:hypothetical protein